MKRRYRTCPHCAGGLARGNDEYKQGCAVCEGFAQIDQFHLAPSVRGLRWVWRMMLEVLCPN